VFRVGFRVFRVCSGCSGWGSGFYRHPLVTGIFKDAVKSVLRISSAHNKGGPTDINIAQILDLSNLFELKRSYRVYIRLEA
jgi:hypothetical protein